MEQTENKLTINNQTLYSHEYSGLRKLEYFRPNIVRLNLPFILTENKMLVLNMVYLKLEGHHVDAILLLYVWDEDGYVFLKIENIKTGNTNIISWFLGYNGDFWLWGIVDFKKLIRYI